MEGLQELLWECAPYLCGWQACYHGCLHGQGLVFDTPRHMKTSDRAYWAASITSSVHALLIVKMSVGALVSTPELADTSNINVTSPQSVLTGHVFWAYIISDTCITLCYYGSWSGTKSMVIHHLFALAGWGLFIKAEFGHFLGLMGLIAEFTTPFVNLRWFLEKARMKSGTLYLVNGVLMASLWFVIRVLGFVYLGYHIFVSRDAVARLPWLHSLTLMATYTVGFALQLYWFQKIARGAAKALYGGAAKQGAL